MAIEQKAIRYERTVPLPPVELVAGLALGLASLAVYATRGYGRPMLLLWLAGVLTLAAYFWSSSARLPQISTPDLVAPGALLLLFSPLYLGLLYRWPVQVGGDELTIMGVSKTYSSSSGLDLFGLSDYFARPTLLFVPWGKIGEAIGGIDLVHMRLLHAVAGLLTIAISYGLFRQLLTRPWAFFASCVFGFSHAFLMISRLAMRENTAVLMEVTAFALLLRGLRHNQAFATYCGGFVAGLGYYVYQPSRATFPIWALFLVLLALLYREQFPLARLARLGLIATVGFVLMVAPTMIAESKATPTQKVSLREALLIYPEARDLQRRWVYASDDVDGIRRNISFGLATFNSHVIDHGWIYTNDGHGFVDPLTGILLWIGVGAVGVGLVRRRRADPLPLLMLVSFFVLWLSFALLINKSPNYTRLLVTLPFVAYLVTEAVRMLARLLERRLRPVDSGRASRAAVAVAVGTLAALAFGNLAISWDYIQAGREKGDGIGSTGRYIAAHRDNPTQMFYVSEDTVFTYYDWGPNGFQIRMRAFVPDNQIGGVIAPDVLRSFDAVPPFSIFMRHELWDIVSPDLTRRYQQSRIRNLTPDGRLLVLEVPTN